MVSHVKKTSLSFDFNKAAAATLGSFPELRDLYIGSTRGPVYVSEAASVKIERSKEYINRYLSERISYMRANMAAGLAFYLRPLPFTESDENHTITSIIVDIHGDSMDKSTPLFVSTAFSPTVDAITVLDHEIGHHVVSGGMHGPSANFKECAADAYAALRHVQRFGNKTDYFEHAPYTRARIITHGFSTAHYTAVVMHKVKHLKNEMNIAALSPQETAALAEKIATEYHLPTLLLTEIRDAFKPLTTWFAAQKMTRIETYKTAPETHPGYFRRIATIMRKHSDNHDIWRAAKLLLSPHMPSLRTDKKWEKMLNAMNAHEKKNGIILDLSHAKDAQNASDRDIINTAFDTPKKPPPAPSPF